MRPADRGAVVDQMLEGVPLPDGFDLDALREGDVVAERSFFRFEVADAVDCAWVEQWFAARESGDTAAKEQAFEAMRTRDSWPVVREIAATENMPTDLPSVADQMEDGTLEPNVLCE